MSTGKVTSAQLKRKILEQLGKLLVPLREWRVEMSADSVVDMTQHYGDTYERRVPTGAVSIRIEVGPPGSGKVRRK